MRRASRVALTAWVVVIVPLLGGELVLILVSIPRLATAFARSMTTQAGAMTAQFGRGEVAAGLVSVISVVLLVFPAVGICYVLLQSGRSAFRAAAAATRKHPALRVPLAAAAIAAAAGLAASWGLLPLPGDHPAATGRPSLAVSPSPALAALPAASTSSHRGRPRSWTAISGSPPRPARGFRPAATTARTAHTARAALKAKPKPDRPSASREARVRRPAVAAVSFPPTSAPFTSPVAVELTRAVHVSCAVRVSEPVVTVTRAIRVSEPVVHRQPSHQRQQARLHRHPSHRRQRVPSSPEPSRGREPIVATVTRAIGIRERTV